MIDNIYKIKNSQSAQELDDIRINLLGRNGSITKALKEIANLPIEERKIKGKEINDQKIEIEKAIEEKKQYFMNLDELSNFDYSTPAKIKQGKRHIISESIELLEKIFHNMNFEKLIGPDIETPYYNFEALNIACDHPARDNNDTFYIENNSENDNQSEKLLRTHVTAVQIRFLESLQDKTIQKRAYSIGRVYRNDSHDATHVSSFHQIEGIIIEDGVTMQNLKGFLEHLYSEFFGQKAKINFRPSYFPFTEPSCEVDIMAKIQNGKLIMSLDNDSKPIEMGGCGIIHPSILDRFDLSNRQAFAFGMGLERAIMLKHGIPNINILYDNEMPFLDLYR
jgi:phenylalanyl-tRNA synthetase alpha chain